MNNNGQVIFFLFMTGLAILVLALALAGPIKEIVDSARAAPVGDTLGLDCENSSISDFNKAACLAADVSIFYFIGGLIFLVGIIMGAKVIFG